MTPDEFKTRYLAALPDDIPPDLVAEVTTFVRFRGTEVQALEISERDKAILVESGLPQVAAPALEFFTDQLLESVPGVRSTATIGSDGFGDLIAIDRSSGAVIKYNHDDEMSPIHLAANVVSLSACLCAYAEYLHGGRDVEAFRIAVGAYDSKASQPESWWLWQIEGRGPL